MKALRRYISTYVLLRLSVREKEFFSAILKSLFGTVAISECGDEVFKNTTGVAHVLAATRKKLGGLAAD
jgi:hypothetical protein